ncbi:hypothetical protein E3P77_03081 [Wallemia ichthyophaga]|nr:hypothetical protein E3P77_03081 [Wallemia ichthyophaga]
MSEYLQAWPEFDTLGDYALTFDVLGDAIDAGTHGAHSAPDEPVAPTQDKPPKKRRRKRNSITKPLNAWLIFRNEFQDKLKAEGCEVKAVGQVSSLASAEYSKLTKAQRDRYNYLANIETENHKLQYPGVKLTRRAKPKKQKQKEQGQKQKQVENDQECVGNNTHPEDKTNRCTESAVPDGLSGIDKTITAMLNDFSIDDMHSQPANVQMVNSCQVDPSQLRPKLWPPKPRSIKPPETDYNDTPFGCFADEDPPNFERSYSLIP